VHALIHSSISLLFPAHQVGKRARSKEADYAVESIGALRRAIPEIWGEAAERSSDRSSSIDKLPVPAVSVVRSTTSDLDSIIQPTSIHA
jgi:putative hydrolase of the HAD superfamily